MELDIRPAFDVGEKVRVTSNSPTTHTRVLKYTCNHIGPIKAQRGIHVFADANALGCHEGANLYSVRFEAEELWGDEVLYGSPVYLDLWEPHIGPV